MDERALKIFSISSFSFSSSSRSSLLSSTTAMGSIKSVAPLPLISCTSPFILFLFSAFTGTTYLPSLIVTILSCKYFLLVCEFTIEFNLSLTDSFLLTICLLMLRRLVLALSDISWSDIMAFIISFSMFLKTLKPSINSSIKG